MERTARALVLLLTLAACPAGSPQDVVTVPPPPGAARGGILSVALAGDVDSLDPHRAAAPSSWFFARALHRGLLAFPADAPGTEPVPDLARALPHIAGGGRTFTFSLREVTFPDGERLSASDVVASIARLRRGGRGIARWLDLIEHVRAPAPDVVRIRTARAAPDLPWILAHPQAAILPAGSPAPGTRLPEVLQGLGPYRLAGYRPERSITLERNPAWTNDPVRGAFVDGIQARVTAARADVDLVLDPGPPDLAPSTGGVRIRYGVPGCVRYLFLNTRIPPFGDRDVRIAIAHAIDRGGLVRGAGTGPARRLLPPTVTGHRDPTPFPLDLDAARAALGRSVRPNGFSSTIVVADAPRDRREARAIARMLAPIGIRVSVRPVEPAVLYPFHYDAGSAPMGIATWCADWPGLGGRNVLVTVAGRGNLAGLSSDGVRRAIARAARDAEARADRWARADARAVGTGALIPLVYPGQPAAMSHRVHGFTGAAMWPRGDPGALWLGAAAAPEG